MALVSVAVVHGLALQWLHAQALDVQPLTRMPAPVLLRLVHATSPLPLVARHPVHKSDPRPPIAANEAGAAGRFLPDSARTDGVAPVEILPVAAEPIAPTPELTELQAVQALPIADGAVRDAGGWPMDTRLTYSLRGDYRGAVYGSGSVQWQRSQGRYQVEVNLRLALLLSMSLVSQGEMGDAGLRPQVYEERFIGSARRVVFDGVAVKFFDGSAERQPPGAQDTASQFVELSRRFATGRQRLDVGAEVPIWLARPNALHLWTYDVVALEALKIPQYGVVPAYHLKPRSVTNPRGQISAELWFAPSLQYLPVRVKISLGDGNYVDLLVEKIEQGG